MGNFRFYKPGQNDRAPLNRTNYDGKFAAKVSLGSPFTATYNPASPYVALDPYSVFDKMQTARTQYTVTDADVQSPFISGQWRADFTDEFPDSSYTVVAMVEDGAFSPPFSVVNMGPIQKSTTGVTGRLTFPAGMGQSLRTLTISVIAIHD